MHPKTTLSGRGRVVSLQSSRHSLSRPQHGLKCRDIKQFAQFVDHVVDHRHIVPCATRSQYAPLPTTQEVRDEDRDVAPLPLPAYGAAPTATPSAADVVLRFIDALNQRDLSALLMMVSDDCLHEDLSHDTSAHSKEEVARFYADVVSSMPERVRVVADDVTSGDPAKVGLIWHMEVDGVEVPCSRGLSFYRVRPRSHTGSLAASGGAGDGGGGGLITYVRQSPEHFIKLTGMVLSATASATPLIDSLGPMALPNFWSNLARGASNMIASAPPVDELLRNLAAAGAANVVPSVTDIMPGVSYASPSAGDGSVVGGGMYGSSGARGGGPARGSVFSSAPSPAGFQNGQRAPSYLHSTLQGPTALPGAPAAAAAVGHPGYPYLAGHHPHHAPAVRPGSVPVSGPATAAASPSLPPSTSSPQMAAPCAAAAAAAAAGAADAATSPARTSPVVFAASVALAEPPSAASAIMDASFASFGSAALDSVGLDSPSAPSAAALGHLVGPTAAAAATAASSLAAVATIAPAYAQGSPLASAAAAATLEPSGRGADLATEPAPRVAPATMPLSSLAGIWEKDLTTSDVDEYEKALDIWQISGVQKATAKLIEGLELALSPAASRGAGGGSGGGSFNIHFLTLIPYFKVTETYPLGGGTAKMRRRDQRSGDAQAHAEALPNGVRCRTVWGAPLAGELEESYTLPDPEGQPDVMHVTSTLRVGGRSATTVQVYQRRRNMSARDLISASERRNGKAHDVLKRFGM